VSSTKPEAAPPTRENSPTESSEFHPEDRPDELWMEEALRCAQRALEAGEVPVGAVVVHSGQVVGRGWNRNITDSDPTAHAEVIALREAGANVGNHRLEGCELFVTIEPCAMCAGALVHARITRLVYGADDPKAGAVQSALQVINHPRLNHRMGVRNGILAGRSAELLQEFFRQRRASQQTDLDASAPDDTA
jgi:tRNA(adenine34) deaminase